MASLITIIVSLSQGSGINFSNLTRTKLYPLAAGRDVAGQSVPFLEARYLELISVNHSIVFQQ